MSTHLTERVTEIYGSYPATAIVMSGQGTNARAILSDSRLDELYDIRAIATDNPDSNAYHLAAEFDLDVISHPAHRFVSPTERIKYFSELSAALRGVGARAVFYAGFMKIVTADFCEEFPGVNVHPADLTILGNSGLPKYRGMSALRDMRNDLGYVRSTVHVVEPVVDSGDALALTESLHPTPGETDAELHARLKALENKTYAETLFQLGSRSVNLAELPLRPSDE